MLLSYVLNPTHATQALADVAARNEQAAPSTQPAAAVAVFGLVPKLHSAAQEADVERVYREIDLPLAPVLYRMEKVGVCIDTGVLRGLATRFSGELERVGERIFELAGRRFNINSPKQLGEVLFTHMGLTPPAVRGKKSVSTAQDVLEQLAEIQGVVGAKQGDLSPTAIDQIANRIGGRIKLFCASDLAFLGPMMCGFDGISSTNSCALPELVLALDRAITGGCRDEAARLEGLLNQFLTWEECFPKPVLLKVATGLRGIRTGPLAMPLPAEKQRKLEEFRAWFPAWSQAR